MSELKPCPFCDATNVKVKCMEEFTYCGRCRQCDALGPDAPTLADAVTRWNDCAARSPDPTRTLRDEFAMAALSGLMGHPQNSVTDRSGDAEICYLYADAMMKEREKADD